MPFRQRIDIALLIGAVALTRFLCRSRYLYDIDSVNFALAIGRFDPRTHQPHPPGYFLYVWLGRLANLVFQDANSALVAVSIAASCGTAVMIYLLAAKWFGTRAAVFSGLLFLLSPLAWFHGVVALTYIVEAFLSALAGYLCWKAWRGSTGSLFAAAVVLGLGAGVRPSSLMLLGPLFLLSLSKASWKQALAAIAVLGAAVFAWFAPMVWESGGPRVYFSALSSLWKLAGGSQTVYNSSPFTSVARFFTILFIFALCFGSAGLLSVKVRRLWTGSTPGLKQFTCFWMAPALLFFTFVFLRFVNSGYLLIVLAPACIWLGARVSEWYGQVQLAVSRKVALVALAAAVNVAIFLMAPVYCSYREIRRFEAELQEVRNAVPRVARPESTLIVGFDSHFLGYRHAGYYLPEYTTLQFPEVSLSEGKRVFAMRHQDTFLTGRLKQAGFSSFILFPLPSGEKAYQQYLTMVEKKLPKADLRHIRQGQREYIFAPIADLPFLFPITGEPEGVYTARNFKSESVNSR